MHLTRFLDKKGHPHWGRQISDGRAQLLDGSLFDGFVPVDREVTIHRRLAPLEPINIFCIGLNYQGHAREMGTALPTRPVVFMKPTSTVTDPGAPIRIPKGCCDPPQVDYEGELAVVISKPCCNVAPDRAMGYIFGYTCANDVSARRWQKSDPGGQWIRGKSFDTFCPLGPVLVTADEIPNPQELRIVTYLNGQVMQEATVADMIFPINQLISFLSQDTTLLPGTVILTGTPAGVGFTRKPPVHLAPGDVVAVEIGPIGRLTNPVAKD